MKRTEAANSSFSKVVPSLQIAWDSTSLGELKLCPTRYKYVIIDGYEPSGVNVHLRFGIEFGAATEVLDRALVAGANHETAAKEAVQYALTSTWDEALGRPWVSGDEVKNRETLIRAVIDYADNFRDDALKTIQLPDGSAAAELSFNFAIPGMEPAATGEIFVFCGYLDRPATWQDRPWITDRKTTAHALNRAYFARYSPDNQISLYSLAGRIIFSSEIGGVIIDATRITKTGTEFARGIVERTPAQLDEWLEDAKFYIGLAELYAERGFWPMNDKACGSTYLDPKTGELSYGCPFRPVCSSDPSIRAELLRLNYRRRVWDPLKLRKPKRNPTQLKNALELT